MIKNVQKLSEIAEKPARHIVGLMSGTSFDGLDIALCKFEGDGFNTKTTLLHFKTVAYEQHFKQELKSVFSKEQVNLLKVTLLNAYIGQYFAELILGCLQEWNFPAPDVDLIASHGQTIFHAPFWQHKLPGYSNATLQIGDGDHIAVKTGIITLSDFRQKHIAAGGEGAPLAIYGDYLILSSSAENRIMLNIGGIANFTFLPSDRDPDRVFSTDVGPGNTLMDQFVQLNYPGRYFDENAALASSGTVNGLLLKELLAHPFFDADFPKTTGPELFNLSYLNAAIERSGAAGISAGDVMATLSAFSAEGIVSALKKAIKDDGSYVVYLSGGGIHNPLLIKNISSQLPDCKFKNTSEIGIDPDAKEAVLFGLLANECVAGKGVDFGDRVSLPSVSMGKISFPD